MPSRIHTVELQVDVDGMTTALMRMQANLERFRDESPVTARAIDQFVRVYAAQTEELSDRSVSLDGVSWPVT